MSDAPASKRAKTDGGETTLDQLKKYTTVVADTGDFESIAAFKPQDATTNPSLVYNAAKDEKYKAVVQKAVDDAKAQGGTPEEQLENAMDHVFVNFGVEILKVLGPGSGRVSTEVDARLSFDKEKSVAKALKFIELYKAAGFDKDRILIKLSSTWEGIQAAAELQKDHGINCNLTLLFNMAQAVACAEAGVRLISPFVGRILDYYTQPAPKGVASLTVTTAAEDPGVISVTHIYNYYKKHGYPVQVMGASFRSLGEITELAGCDLLTIGPKWLKIMQESTDPIEVKLTVEAAKASESTKMSYTEEEFRYQMCSDPMATHKLNEGIRGFAKDQEKLEAMIKDML